MNRRYFFTSISAGAVLTGCSRKDETSGPPAVDKSGESEIAYAIELDDPANPGMPMRVREDHEFHSGDRFRFLFQPGFDAYVYLFNRGPGQASYQALFPNPKIAIPNPIPSGKTVTVPAPDMGWLRMDQRKGEENLVLIASVMPLDEMQADASDGQAGAIGRDDFESRLAQVERRARPSSSRRFEDKDWVKLFAARDKGDVAIVQRLPLLHS
jgi:hypothetical protein